MKEHLSFDSVNGEARERRTACETALAYDPRTYKSDEMNTLLAFNLGLICCAFLVLAHSILQFDETAFY